MGYARAVKESENEVAKRLIGALEADAELVDRGGFTIDEQAARTKFARFRMSEPQAWLCLLVEAAGLLGARSVEIVTGLDQVRVVFDGEPLAGDEVFSSAAESVSEPEGRSARAAQRKLAIAFNTLFDPLGVGAIVIESARGRVRLQHEGPAERSSCAATRTTILVLGLAGTLREQALVRERCRYSALRVTLDYAPISLGMVAALREAEVRSHAPLLDAQGRTIGYVGTGWQPRDSWLLTHGVLAERLPVAGGVAIVDTSLAKDLGEHKVIRDAAFDQLVAQIEARIAALPEIGEPLDPQPQRQAEPARSPDDEEAFKFRLGLLVLVVMVVVTMVLLD